MRVYVLRYREEREEEGEREMESRKDFVAPYLEYSQGPPPSVLRQRKDDRGAL